jgi:hypothetical protein
MAIPNDIKRKIEEEANWRSTNGHGGVEEITRDNFILAASWGYELAYKEILESKGLVKQEKIDSRCICGHLHSEHRPISSVNYSAGRCTIGECRCTHFLIDK